MPNFPWRTSGGVPPAGDGALDELLAAGQPPQETASGLLPVAEVLAALQAGPSGSELAGKARALAEFRDAAGMSRRVLPRRTGVLRTLVSAKIAAGAAIAVVVGTAAAAYAGVLPVFLQKVAHSTIAAPAASASATPATHPSAGPGPAAAGAGAVRFGLCNSHRHGSNAQRAAARREQVKTIGGAGSVTPFCASTSRARASHSSPGAPAQHRRGRRPAHLAGMRSTHPRDKRPAHHPGERFPHPVRGWFPSPPGQQFPYPRGGQLSYPTGQRPPHPAGEGAAHPRKPSLREAGCGSAPGAQQTSHVHPSAPSGRGGGC